MENNQVKIDDIDTSAFEMPAQPIAGEIDTSAFDQPAPAVVPQDESIDVIDVAKLFGQGFGYNTVDELLGALRASKKLLKGEIKPEEKLFDVYRQEQKAEEKAIKELEEQYPKTAFAAEMAGGFVSPINKLLLPAKIAGMAGAAGQAATKIPVSELIKEGAKLGVKGGLISGIGGSEVGIDQPLEYAKDIAASGVTGGAIGGGLSTLGATATRGIPALAKKLGGTTEFWENFGKAFKKSEEGRGLYTKESAKRIRKESDILAQEFPDLIYGEEGPIEKTKKEFSKYLEEAGKAGAKALPDENIIGEINGIFNFLESNQQIKPKKFGASPQIDENSLTAKIYNSLKREGDVVDTLVSKEAKVFANQVDKYLEGNMTPSEAYTFGRWLEGREVSPFTTLKGSKFAEVIGKLPQVGQSIKQSAMDAVERSTGVSGAPIRQKYKDVRSKLVETFLNKGLPEKYSTSQQRDYLTTEVKADIYEQFRKIINKIKDPSGHAEDKRELFDNFVQRVDELNTAYPDLKIEIKPLLNKLEDIASEKEIFTKLRGEQHASASGEGSTGKFLDKMGYGGAILAGKISGPVKRVSGSLNNKLVNATDEALLPVAQKLKQIPGIAHLGTALEEGVINKSKKNAALFMILQNPEAKNAIKGMFGEEENENR